MNTLPYPLTKGTKVVYQVSGRVDEAIVLGSFKAFEGYTVTFEDEPSLQVVIQHKWIISVAKQDSITALRAIFATMSK